MEVKKIGLKIKFCLFLIFSITICCSLGAVSAANSIHDVTIDDTNTVIEHPEANIQDSGICNHLIKTDYTIIHEAVSGAITSSLIYNKLASSNQANIDQGTASGSVQDSIINNEII